MANLTDQDNIILWDKLDGVTEFKHKFDEQVSKTRCSKCCCLLLITEPKSMRSCPIPDKYPGSEADIAEKIRQWLGKDSNMKYQSAYHHILYDKYKDIQFELSRALWFLMECTPADKIQAFITMFKGEQK